jgi:biopolymer transport protein ExbD
VITKREARGIIRQAVKRVPEGEEIRHLNIMPMMDIMTILLVAFLVLSVEASAAIEVNNVELPPSQSYEPQPEIAEYLTITPRAILIGGVPFLEVKNGDVDPSKKKDGALGLTIPELSQFLGAIRKDGEAKLLARGRTPPEHPELIVFADKTTPFKLLYQVIASSRTEEAGYRRFRLMVLQASE